MVDVIRIDEARIVSMAGEVPVEVEDRHRASARAFLAAQHSDPEAALAALLAQAEAGDVTLEVRHLNGLPADQAYPAGLRVALHGVQLIEQLWRKYADKRWSGKFGPARGVHSL